MVKNHSKKLTRDQIIALCQRGFGDQVKVVTVQELEGGTFNETYRIEFIGENRVILRVAPPTTEDFFWDDIALMRREYAILPYFSSIASLMPKVLLVDFTHQIVNRDYMFQSFIDGERWSDIEDELTPAENLILWQQCGEIVKQIHNTTRTEPARKRQFGYPYPGKHFSKWNEMVLYRLERIAENMSAYQLDLSAFSTILQNAQAHINILDEIQIPHLLHGDLWTFNLLVNRSGNTPTIVGLIDVDRSYWGDPMADWIIFLLEIRRGEKEWQPRISAFERGYESTEIEKKAQFRLEIYKAMHIGLMAVWGAKHGDQGDMRRAKKDLHEIAQRLPLLVS